MEKKDIRKMFPHLFNELEIGEVKVSIDGIRKNPAEAEGEVARECNCNEYVDEVDEVTECTETPDRLRHFNPQAVDFLRRCDTEAQAEEIIAYLQKKGEITAEYAEQLRVQLKKDGVRAFGPKKEENYYFQEGGIY
jgi:hypothetical protein